MAQKKVKRIHLSLDKVERKKLLEVAALNAEEYAGLEPAQIVHLELKRHLFQRAIDLRKREGAQARI